MNDNANFSFHDPGELIDGDLELVLVSTFSGDLNKGYVPSYNFEMRLVGKKTPLGRIALRIGDTEAIRGWVGHIGYQVGSPYRGHHYAARSCRLLLALAKRHGIAPVWITCNPENIASRRTCELAGARFVEIVEVPHEHEIYKKGEPLKCRYRLDR